MIKTLKLFLFLTRIEKPIGIVLLLFPCWWGMAYVQKLSISLPFFILFLVGAVVMRSAGCVLNDFFDRDFDRKVARTKERPLASGLLSGHQALLFFVFLCFIGWMIFVQLPAACWSLCIIALVLLIIYPLMKRITSLPQFVLGIAFNIGFLIAIVACTERLESINTFPVFLIYSAAVLWTVGYDTIYAVQDCIDDIKIGVKSTAILFGKHTKIITMGIYIISAFLIGLAGIFQNHSPFYFLFSFIGYSYIIGKLGALNLDDRDACRKFFVLNQWVGVALFLAFLFS